MMLKWIEKGCELLNISFAKSIFLSGKVHIDGRFKTICRQISLILRGTPSIPSGPQRITFSLLCCTVHDVPNDGEEMINAVND